MFHTRVASRHLGSRLDSGFYDPDYLAAHAAIAKFTLRTLDSLRARSAPLNKGVVKPRFQDSSVRMVRIQDFDDPFVDLDASATIDPLQMTEFRRSVCLPGDLLVALGGYPGRLGILPKFPDEVTGVNINPHIVRIRLADNVSKAYVVAFLSSEIGRKLLARQVSGSVQASINLQDFRVFEVPLMAPLAQRYIGDKVRQAEGLRDRARLLQAESRAFFLLPEWSHPRAGTRHSYRGRAMAMLSDRLDAPFYDPAHFDLERVLRRHDAVSIGALAESIATRWDKTDPRLRYIEIGDVDVRSGAVQPTLIARADAPASAQVLVAPHDVLVATVRPNRKNIGFVPTTTGLPPLVASSAFAALRFKTSAAAAFYHAFLRSDAATHQLTRWTSGSTYPTVDSEVASVVLAPRYEESVVQRLGRRWLMKFDALDGAEQLVDSSKCLIEQLIDGRLTEAEVVAAQKALEANDRSADREILKGLRQSDAPDAKLLNANIDALYALLDASEVPDA